MITFEHVLEKLDARITLTLSESKKYFHVDVTDKDKNVAYYDYEGRFGAELSRTFPVNQDIPSHCTTENIERLVYIALTMFTSNINESVLSHGSAFIRHASLSYSIEVDQLVEISDGWETKLKSEIERISAELKETEVKEHTLHEFLRAHDLEVQGWIDTKITALAFPENITTASFPMEAVVSIRSVGTWFPASLCYSPDSDKSTKKRLTTSVSKKVTIDQLSSYPYRELLTDMALELCKHLSEQVNKYFGDVALEIDGDITPIAHRIKLPDSLPRSDIFRGLALSSTGHAESMDELNRFLSKSI